MQSSNRLAPPWQPDHDAPADSQVRKWFGDESMHLEAGALRLLEQVTRGFGWIRFSPFDLRFYVRLTLAVLAWKHASQDYGGMAYLSTREPIYTHTLDFVQSISITIQRTLLSTETNVLLVQFLGLAACVLAFVRPSRLSLALCFVTVSLIEFPAYLWRLQNWDFDLPLAVLLMIVAAPCSLRDALSSSRKYSPEAQVVGSMLAVYMAGMYFLAGVSKVVFSPTWFSDVQFGNNWRTQFLDNAEYGGLSALLGEQASGAFLTFAPIAAFIALIVMIDQILMPLALVHRHFRMVGPLLIFLNHMGIALALGVFFSSMPVLGPAIFLPWRAIIRRKNSANQNETSEGFPDHFPIVRIFLAATAAAIVVLIPGLTHTVYHPFADNYIFGWAYPKPESYGKVYAIGFWDEDTETYVPMPRGYGGFLESRQTTTLHYQAIALRSSPNPELGGTAETLICASRPRNSNSFLLGPFAMPAHRWSAVGDFDLAVDKTFHILEGTGNLEDMAEVYAPVRVTWDSVAVLGEADCQATQNER